jgi:hypothetical protein
MQPRRSEAFNVWSERVATRMLCISRFPSLELAFRDSRCFWPLFLHSNLLFGKVDVLDLLCCSTLWRLCSRMGSPTVMFATSLRIKLGCVAHQTHTRGMNGLDAGDCSWWEYKYKWGSSRFTAERLTREGRIVSCCRPLRQCCAVLYCGVPTERYLMISNCWELALRIDPTNPEGASHIGLSRWAFPWRQRSSRLLHQPIAGTSWPISHCRRLSSWKGYVSALLIPADMYRCSSNHQIRCCCCFIISYETAGQRLLRWKNDPEYL